MKLLSITFAILLIGSSFCPFKGYGQKTPVAIQTYFSQLATLKQLNGNMLLATSGKPVIVFSSGFADFNKQKTNTSFSRFNLASISKIFTSTAILQLRDKGKLSLDEPLKKYISDFPFADVTIRHLLTHTSGLPDLELFEDLVKQFPDTVMTNKDVIPELKKWKRGLNFKPGDKYQYCNTEYNLLAILIEKLSGISFNDYLRENIFRPCGMASTYVSLYPHPNEGDDPLVVTMHMQAHPRYDTTYVPVNSLARFRYLVYNNQGTVGAGNVISTTADLLRFDRAFFAGRLLKKSSVNEAFIPVKLNDGTVYYSPSMDTIQGEGKMSYGLGWEILEQPVYGRSVGHGGFKFGLATYFLHNLDKDQTIIGFDNTAGPEFGQVITSAQLLLNAAKPLPFRTKKSLVTAYGMALVQKGPDHAASIFNALKSDTLNYYLNDWEMNDLGYHLFYAATFADHQKLALEVFKLATFVFPDRFNPYDSYGQLLRETGNREDAILMYRKSIQLNPKNEDGIKALNELLGTK